MVSLFEDQLIDDVVTRAEQSRVSYNIQTEEFRNLNANLQTYLNDIKTIDDDNRQLQENIEEIRTNYILSLENHLKRLPFDFRQQSQTLTGAHLERYKSKSRAKRFTNEREELKRRIHFVASNEKEQTKRLNTLQKQERTVRNEFNKLNEQIQNLSNYVENEKQNYHQAMDRVDNLHVQLEEISVERSKTEFEIQTLKEEVKLMQTAKEFLDEERETIIATQTDANEYLLSRLNESINRIREDFHELNQTQLKQTENEYKQMLQILEEHFMTNETIDETTTTHQRAIQADYERLHNEHQSVLQELTTLKDHNETLSERVFSMETDLHSLHDERMQELITKDNELERTKIELQTLNEKLNNLAEYDRNLKFELTLYRGVLESEYRRKQSAISTQHLIRPTTLRSNNNSMTDRTVWLTSSTNANKLNNQQQEEEILTSRPRVQSEYDPLGEDINVQIDDVIATKTTSSGEKLASGGSLWQQLIDPFSHEPQQDIISITNISQDAEKHSDLLSTTIPGEDQSASAFEVQQLPSQTSTISSAKRNSPASPTSSILREDQSASSQTQRAPITPPELQSLPAIQATSPATTTLVSSDVHQPPSILAQENQTLSEIQQASSRTSSIGSAISYDIQRSPTSATASTIPEHQPSTSVVRQSPSTPPQEHQPSSRTSSAGSAALTDIQRRPSTTNTSTVPEHQSSSRTSSVGSVVPSDIQPSPESTTSSTVLERQTSTSDVPQSPSLYSQEHQSSSHTSSVGSAVSSAVQRSAAPVTASAMLDHQSPTSDARQSPSTPPQEQQPSSRTSSIGSAIPYDTQRSRTSVTSSTVLEHQLPSLNSPEHQSSRTSSVGSAVLSDIQRSPASGTAPTVSEDQSSTSVVRQSPSIPTQEQQPSSRTSSVGSAIPYDTGRSPTSATASAITEHPPATSDVPQSPSLYSQEHQSSSSSRTSSLGSAVSSAIQRSSTPVTTSANPEYQPPTSDAQQSPSTPPQEHYPSSRTSSLGSAIPYDTQRSHTSATSSTVVEHQPSTSDVQQSRSLYSEEYQSSSRTSSVGSAIPSDIQRLPTSGTAPTVSADQSPTYDPRESPFTASADRAMLSEIESSPITDASTREDVQETTSPVVIDDYKTSIVNSQLGKSFVETTDTIEHEESTPHVTDERATGEMNLSERHKSIHSMGRSSMEEYEISLDIDRDASRSSSFALTSTPRSERKQSFPQSDTNISSVQDHKSQLMQNYSPEQTKTEEEKNSSLAIKPEEINLIDNSSSAITNDYQLDDNLYESNPFSLPDTSKQSSHSSSLTDVEDVDASTSQKFETRFDDSDDPKLAVIMQDLRSVFLELANTEDLVEINNNFPNELLDRLEFHEHIIRTFFDSLLRKYLVQAAAQGNRSTTLDWIEFRDILFPLLAGRYTEQHIRKLFDLFDTSKDGYLSLQEIAELLEVLQASDTIYLAQSIIDEYDTDHDGKLSVDELIEAIKNTDYINENVLSKDTENQEWFNPSPTDIQTITLEVPIINFPSRADDKFSKGISLLGRIFQKVGANSETKQLDSNNKNLSMQITNEFIINNINISSDDLQLFIQLFLNKKQNTDPLINWIEFRDIFLPIINNGFYSKTNIEQWFDILDTNQNGIITREEVIQLLRLLQIQHPEEIINKLNADNIDQWTLDELMFALDNVDETATHLQTDNEQIASFDINWLSNNVF